MNRAFILIALLLSISIGAISQEVSKVLTYERVENGTELFSNKENWSEIIVQYKGDFDLKFEIPWVKIVDRTATPVSIENLDKSSQKAKAILAKKTVNDNDVEYTIWVRVIEGKPIPDMTISATSTEVANKVIIPMGELQPKQRIRYRLYDPFDSSAGSVFQYHKVMGTELFNDSNYPAARQEFVLASYCEAPSIEKQHVLTMIANCDTMASYTKRIEQYINDEQWMDAIRWIRYSGRVNPSDQYLINTYNYCNKKLLNESNKLLAEAQDLYDRGQYAEAKSLYDKVAQFRGPYASVAKERSKLCDETYKMESNRERYIGVELGIGGITSFGITKGKYNAGVTTYQSWRINADIFNLLRQRYYINEHARLDITPITIAFPIHTKTSDIYRGVWLNMGVGVTAANKYKPKAALLDWAIDNDYATDADGVTQQMVDTYMQENDLTKSTDVLSLDINFACTPEIGAVVKIWKFGLRLTYRHHIPFGTTMKGLVGTNQLSVGIGYCY